MAGRIALSGISNGGVSWTSQMALLCSAVVANSYGRQDQGNNSITMSEPLSDKLPVDSIPLSNAQDNSAVGMVTKTKTSQSTGDASAIDGGLDCDQPQSVGPREIPEESFRQSVERVAMKLKQEMERKDGCKSEEGKVNKDMFDAQELEDRAKRTCKNCRDSLYSF